MQGQAHNIDDLGAPNWRATGAGDDLIIKFWKWKRQALKNDDTDAEYYQRWDGITLDPSEIAMSAPDAAEVRSQAPTHAGGDIAAEGELRQDYITNMPAADYPPINWRPYPLVQEIVERHMQVCEEATRTHTALNSLPVPFLPLFLSLTALPPLPTPLRRRSTSDPSSARCSTTCRPSTCHRPLAASAASRRARA